MENYRHLIKSQTTLTRKKAESTKIYQDIYQETSM